MTVPADTLKCFVKGCESKGSGVVCAPCYDAQRADRDALAERVKALEAALRRIVGEMEGDDAYEDAYRIARRVLEEGK